LGALFAFAKLKNYFLRIDDLDKPASDVELIIYNQLGEQILKKEMPTNAGSYNIHWDGESESGATLPSGVYFYNLKVDDKRETKSMVLLK
jgi:flagellar hook assembly protein FlgD